MTRRLSNKKNNNESSVCFILEDFYPLIHGASTQTILLSQRFIRNGHTVMVITRQIKAEDPPKETYRGIRITRVKPAVGVHRLGKYLMLVPTFLALAQQRKDYDIIVVADLKVIGLVGVLAARILGKKCLLNQVTCGEMDGSFATMYEATTGRGKELLVKALVSTRNRVIRNADRFVSISTAISNEFVRSGIPEHKISQIYYGIDTEKFNKLDDSEKISLRKRLGMGSKRYFVFTGRLINGKGLRYLLRVWNKLSTEYRDIHLMIVGSGQGHVLSCEQWLKNFVNEKKLDKTVSFVGGVSDVSPYLKAGDYFVFPSKSEGLGLSLIEAMACELACIASSVGGILDIINNGENGILVPYGDEEKLYTAMKEVMEDDQKSQKIKKAGRQTVLERFDIELKAKEYISLFSQL